MTIKVLRGNPTPEGLAAALAVVGARAAAMRTPPPSARVRDAWSDPSRVAAHRLPPPSQAAWTRTYWPS
ncbi:acyl-CoA carboxylase epsilon subunit [Streptomyces malaysiensis]|uniref:acyl-CoA carboxylase epsilon subunit n=1 Tax=Streptomyces malaysiensis TaxID=92644 RepID=UPI002B322F81|nr:acyl-CoA carboxylase epsilon subunit [Streptomyces malaysiensis]